MRDRFLISFTHFTSPLMRSRRKSTIEKSLSYRERRTFMALSWLSPARKRNKRSGIGRVKCALSTPKHKQQKKPVELHAPANCNRGELRPRLRRSHSTPQGWLVGCLKQVFRRRNIFPSTNRKTWECSFPRTPNARRESKYRPRHGDEIKNSAYLIQLSSTSFSLSKPQPAPSYAPRHVSEGTQSWNYL